MINYYLNENMNYDFINLNIQSEIMEINIYGIYGMKGS